MYLKININSLLFEGLSTLLLILLVGELKRMEGMVGCFVLESGPWMFGIFIERGECCFLGKERVKDYETRLNEWFLVGKGHENGPYYV